jgi:uncharacterized protein
MEQCLEINQDTFNFIWHGGEPTLLGVEYYEEVVSIQKEIFEDSPIKVYNSIQSNGLLLNERWFDFFALEDWDLGISLDGPEEIHDIFRRDHEGGDTFKTIFQNIAPNGEFERKIGVSAVIHNQSIKHAGLIYEFLKQFKTFDIAPCLNPAGSEETLSFAIHPLDYAQFFTEMFDLWWFEDNPNIDVRKFSAYIQGVLGRTPRLCSMSNGCRDFLCIEANGSVYPCGRMAGFPDLLLGNIHQTSLAKIINEKPRQNYLHEALVLPAECQKCKWAHACFNGCSMHRYLGNGQFLPKTVECEATKKIFAHVALRIKETRPELEVSEEVKEENIQRETILCA